jgi:PPIC-type PPIASE domain
MISTPFSPMLLLTVTLACGLTLSCDQHKSPVEGVVVTVNGTAITQEDIAFVSRGADGGHQMAMTEDKANILEGVIVQELAYQRAVQLGLDADPVYQAELRNMEAQVNAFRRKKLSEMLLKQELLKKATVSDAEAQQYFNANAARLRTEIHVWQILRRDEQTMKAIQAELAQDLPFEKVAGKLFPNLPASAGNPWDLGYLKWNQVPDVWNVVYSMQVGETSDIIRGPKNRFWIIKLIDRRENKDLGFEQVKPVITDILKDEKTRQLREATIKDLRDNASIVYAK